MSPKEKAKELFDKFLPYSYYNEMNNSMNRSYQQEDNAKQCALILVKEVLNMLFQHNEIDYWKEVKEEINKL